MNLESPKYLEDILDSIEIIKSYMKEVRTFSEYGSNLMLIDAV